MTVPQSAPDVQSRYSRAHHIHSPPPPQGMQSTVSSSGVVGVKICTYKHNVSNVSSPMHSLHNFCKQPQQPDFHFKISGFLAAIKLTDKSGYPDNGYPDMQTLIVSSTAAFLSVIITLCNSPWTRDDDSSFLMFWQLTFYDQPHCTQQWMNCVVLT